MLAVTEAMRALAYIRRLGDLSFLHNHWICPPFRHDHYYSSQKPDADEKFRGKFLKAYRVSLLFTRSPLDGTHYTNKERDKNTQ